MTEQKRRQSEIEKRVAEIIKSAVQERKVSNYLIKPKIPEVMVNPDFLIVPSPGTLISLDILTVPSNNSLWDFSLDNIEGLIETKLATGPFTVVGILLIYSSNVPEISEAIRLLKQLFDFVIEVSFNDVEFERKIFREIIRILDNPITNERSNTFIQLESRLRSENFELLSNKPNVQKIIKQITDASSRDEDYSLDLTERQIFEQVIEMTNVSVIQEQKVFNLKPFFMNSADRYFFTFDFMVRPNHLSNIPQDYPLNDFWLEKLFEAGGSLNEIVTIKGKKSTILEKLRRFATYARFISYKFSSSFSDIQPLTHKPNLNLIIKGDLKGPEHAPERYINMLLAAGWNLVRPNDIERDIFIRRGER